MPVLLKSGLSASREEAVEEIKDFRSMKKHWYRSKVMPEYGLRIFYDRLKPRSNHKLPEYPWTTRNPIYVIYKPLLTATRSWSFLLFIFLTSERKEEILQSPLGTPLSLVLISIAFYIYFFYDFWWQLHVWIDPPVRFRVQIGWGISPKYRLLSCRMSINWISLIACVLESWTRTIMLGRIGAHEIMVYLLSNSYCARIPRERRELI